MNLEHNLVHQLIAGLNSQNSTPSDRTIVTASTDCIGTQCPVKILADTWEYSTVHAKRYDDFANTVVYLPIKCIFVENAAQEVYLVE